jgi:TusA-related sulfurtransferase
MPDNHLAVSQEVDQYASQRIAATAAAKAKRLWPGIIGEVLADEIMALLDLPSWMRSQTRTHQLIDAIQDIAEETAASSNERPAA